MRKILITSGGTSEYIDSVRKITNSSTGKLGVTICEDLIKRDKNCEIFYVHSKGALTFNNERVKNIEVLTTSDLEEVMREILIREDVSICIHAMAVSDYTKKSLLDFNKLETLILNGIPMNEALEEATIRDTNKINSSYNELGVILKKTPKIIEMIKKLSPYTFLVGFKLLDSVSEEELFDVGFNLLRKNRCNLVLANDLSEIKKGNHTGMIIYPEKTKDIVCGKKEISKELITAIYNRVDCKHPKSIRLKDAFNVDSDLFLELKENGKLLYNNGLLPEVVNHNNHEKIGTYGNLSVKLGNGEFIISGRNVHKGCLTKEDICLVQDVVDITDHNSIYSNVHYNGVVKPSIDSSIHSAIYKTTNAKSIIHIHTNNLFLGVPTTDYNYPCGSEEELLAIIESIKNTNSSIIQLHKHGLIILGESLTDCTNQLLNLYSNTPYINYDCKYKGVDYKGELGLDESFNEHVEKTNATFVKNKGIVYPIELKEKLLGHIWECITETEKQFAINLFPESKGYKIVDKYLFSNQNVKLMLFTTPACNIADFYIKKYGFSLLYTNRNLIVLNK